MMRIDPISMLLAGIMLICGYLALAQSVSSAASRSSFAYGNRFLIHIVLLLLYGTVCGITGLFYIYSGYNELVIFLALGLGVLVGLALFLRHLLHERHIRWGYAAAFVLYFGAVLYLTVFMRFGSVQAGQSMTSLAQLKAVLTGEDTDTLVHMLLNVALFLPLGYLIPAMEPCRLGKWSDAFLGGVMCSTVIESVQLFFQLGNCDTGDIIANSLGAVLGYGCLRFCWQFQKNWRL